MPALYVAEYHVGSWILEPASSSTCAFPANSASTITCTGMFFLEWCGRRSGQRSSARSWVGDPFCNCDLFCYSPANQSVVEHCREGANVERVVLSRSTCALRIRVRRLRCCRSGTYAFTTSISDRFFSHFLRARLLFAPRLQRRRTLLPMRQTGLHFGKTRTPEKAAGW